MAKFTVWHRYEGTYTLKADISLELRIQLFYNDYVQTVLSYELNRYACLKAKPKVGTR